MIQAKCRVCEKDAPLTCGACKSAFYCSRTCQIKDWRYGRHSLVCATRNLFPEFQRITDMLDRRRDDSDSDALMCGLDLTEAPAVCMHRDQTWGAYRETRFAVPYIDLSATQHPVLKKLGSGSFGAVNQRDFGNGPVAVKELLLENSFDLDNTDTHELEMRNFDHPNIAGACMAGFAKDDPTTFAMVMDVANGSLYEYILDAAIATSFLRAPFDPLETAFLIYQIFKGVAHQHEHMVINFDNKPGNILLTGITVPAWKFPTNPQIKVPMPQTERMMPHVKITDYGLSWPFRFQNEHVEMQYTSNYSPPEVLLGNMLGTYSGESWAAGVMAYQVAAGMMMFPGKSSISVILEVVKEIGVPTPALQTTWYTNLMSNPPQLEKLELSASQARRYRKLGGLVALGQPASLERMLRRLIEIDPTQRADG